MVRVRRVIEKGNGEGYREGNGEGYIVGGWGR